MISFKRAQGLPITTIIIAVLGLIVLFVLLAIVTQRTSLFGKGLSETAQQTCAPNKPAPIGTDCQAIYGSFKDVSSSEICCKLGTVPTQ